MSFKYAESGDAIFGEVEITIHSWDLAPKVCRVCQNSGSGRPDSARPTATDPESVALAAQIPAGAPWHYTKCSRCGAERGATADQSNWHYYFYQRVDGFVHELVPPCTERPENTVVASDIRICSYCGHLTEENVNCARHPQAELRTVQGFRVA